MDRESSNSKQTLPNYLILHNRNSRTVPGRCRIGRIPISQNWKCPDFTKVEGSQSRGFLFQQSERIPILPILRCPKWEGSLFHHYGRVLNFPIRKGPNQVRYLFCQTERFPIRRIRRVQILQTVPNEVLFFTNSEGFQSRRILVLPIWKGSKFTKVQ